MTFRELRATIGQTFSDWNDHDAPRLGAALAFYMALSLAPLVVLTLAGVGLVFGQSTAQTAIVTQFESVIGVDGANAVRSVIRHAHEPSTGSFASILGVMTLLFGASGVFVELRCALNQIWNVKSAGGGGFAGMVKQRFFSFVMVLAVGFLLLTSLLVGATVATLGKFFEVLLPVPEPVLTVLHISLSWLAIGTSFALIFKYVPDARVGWREAWLGGIVTAMLSTIGNSLIGLYLGKAAVGSAYGAAGSLIVIILWVYYSAMIFFLGAEFTHVVAERRTNRH
jgi:membrane protein